MECFSGDNLRGSPETQLPASYLTNRENEAEMITFSLPAWALFGVAAIITAWAHLTWAKRRNP